MDFRGERLKNETRESRTDPEARLMRKGKGREARLSFMGHALMENGNWLLMDFVVSRATGRAEREAVPVMRGYRPRTLGADKGYDTRECVRAMRNRGVTPHVARRTHSAIDGRTTRHSSYRASQKVRKRMEEVFGWMKRRWEGCGGHVIGVLSGRAWLGTLWQRPTTWCGWRTWRRVIGLGLVGRRDPLSVAVRP